MRGIYLIINPLLEFLSSAGTNDDLFLNFYTLHCSYGLSLVKVKLLVRKTSGGESSSGELECDQTCADAEFGGEPPELPEGPPDL
jgi:hypothetical protein